MESLKLSRSVFSARARIGPPPVRVAPGLKRGERHRDAADVVSGCAEAGQPLFRERQPLRMCSLEFLGVRGDGAKPLPFRSVVPRDTDERAREPLRTSLCGGRLTPQLWC